MVEIREEATERNDGSGSSGGTSATGDNANMATVSIIVRVFKFFHHLAVDFGCDSEVFSLIFNNFVSRNEFTLDFICD